MTVVDSIHRILFASVLVIVATFPAALLADDTRASMRMVYQALSELLPASMDEQSFDTEQGIERLSAALEVLEVSAHTLTLHGEQDSAEFTALARSFQTNISLLRQSLDYGRYHEFNYLVLDLTHNCVSCHARLPSGSGPSFASDLLGLVEDELASGHDRALLQIAIRQFDDAIMTLEGVIDDPAIEPLDLELNGVLFDYLILGVTVITDPDRVIDTLGRFAMRKDLPYYMARYIEQWSAHLDALRVHIDGDASFESTLTLFDESLTLSPIPSSQVRVVYDLVVAAMLRRLLEDNALDRESRAQAYWMLGVISIRTVNPRPGVPHTELLFDAAIRAAPNTDIARQSYALLEEYNRVSFSGISNAELPDALLNLDQLRKLAGVDD